MPGVIFEFQALAAAFLGAAVAFGTICYGMVSGRAAEGRHRQLLKEEFDPHYRQAMDCAKIAGDLRTDVAGARRLLAERISSCAAQPDHMLAIWRQSPAPLDAVDIVRRTMFPSVEAIFDREAARAVMAVEISRAAVRAIHKWTDEPQWFVRDASVIGERRPISGQEQIDRACSDYADDIGRHLDRVENLAGQMERVAKEQLSMFP